MFKLKGLLKNSYIVASGTLISRILGYLREIAVTAWLGTGAASDAFVIASRIPALFRRVATEGGLQNVLIPILNELEKFKRKNIISSLITKIMVILTSVYLSALCFSVLFPKFYLSLVAPGIINKPVRLFWALKFNFYTTASIIFFFLSGLFSAVLNNRNKFFWPSIAPAFFNITITGLTMIAYIFDISVIYIGHFFLISSVAQMLACLIPYLNLNIPINLNKADKKDPAIEKFFKKFIPVVFSSSTAQIGSLVAIILSSYLAEGSTTIMHRAERFFQLPLSIAASFSTALLPSLSKASQNKVSLRKTAIKVTVAIFIPFSIFLYFLSEPLVKMTFLHGKCTLSDTQRIAEIIKLYSFGIPSFLLTRVLPIFFFAEGLTKIPTRAAIANTIVDIVISILLITPLQSTGLVLAQIISSWANTIILIYFIIKKGYLKEEKETISKEV